MTPAADRSGQKDVHLGVHVGFGAAVTIASVAPNEFRRRYPEPQAEGSSPAGDARLSLA